MGLSYAICRFVLLPSAVGIICCACNFTGESVPESRTDVLTESLSAELEILEGDDSETATGQTLAGIEDDSDTVAAERGKEIAAQSAAYQEGINLASSAYSLSQSAVSPDDWGLVASRWQRAADQLERITADNKNYSVAQSKIAEYVVNAQYATERIASLQAAAQAPLPSIEESASTPKTVRLPRSQPSAPLSPRAQIPQSSIASSAARTRTVTAPATSSSAVRIPVVRRLHGTPVVRVTFNDAQTYEMILDTGASRTLITRAMANELGIVANDRMIAATASEAQVTFDLGQMRSISIGEIRLNNAQVSIGDSVDIGLLGNDFLRGYDVTIRNREVELSPAR